MKATRRALVGDSFFNTLNFAASAVLQLVLIRLAIDRMGLEAYGVWSLASVVISTSSLLNIGFADALTQRSAEDYGSGELGNVRSVLWLVDLLFLAACTLLFVAVLFLRRVLLGVVFGIGGEQSPQAGRLLLFMVPLSFLTLLNASRKAVIAGLQRLRQASIVSLAGRLVNFGVALGLLLFSKLGVWSLYLSVAVENLLLLIVFSLLLRRYRPAGESRPRIVLDKSFFRTLRFATGLQAGTLVNFAVEIFYKSLVSRSLGLAALARFQIAWRAIQIVQGLVNSALRPLFPASAFLLGKGNLEGLRLVFSRSMRLAVVLGAASLVLILPFVQPVFSLWLGSTDTFQVITTQMLCLWVFFATLAAPGYLFVMGSGNSRFCLLAQVVASSAAMLFLFAARWLLKGQATFLIGASYACGGLVGLLLTWWSVRRIFAWKVPAILRKESGFSYLLLLLLPLAAVFLARRWLSWPYLDYALFAAALLIFLALSRRLIPLAGGRVFRELGAVLRNDRQAD